MNELFKENTSKFFTIFFDDKTDLENRSFRDIEMKIVHNEDGVVDYIFDEVPTKRKKKELEYKKISTSTTEEDFVKNYGNQLTTIRKDYMMIVVESSEDKVSLKIFSGIKVRARGNRFFRVRKNLVYLSVNKKTGDVYNGNLTNFNLKKNKRSTISRNNFTFNAAHRLVQEVKVRSANGDSYMVDKLIQAIQIFAKELSFKTEGDVSSSLSDQLLEFYLKKKNIKYPDNFKLFWKDYAYKLKLSDIRKNGNKIVDAFMSKNELKGAAIKKALHQTEHLNLPILNLALFMFPNDWIHQDDYIINKCLNFNTQGSYYNSDLGGNIDELKMSNSEKRRMYEIFRNEVMNNKLPLYTFFDHIRFYRELKYVGEEGVKWTAKNKDEFTNEHLVFSEKLDFYKKGHYFRDYPQYMYDVLEIPFEVKGEYYYPVLLDNSTNYNQESTIQSNCVKNYVGTAGAVIVSLRKGDRESGVRATIELRLSKSDKENITFTIPQALGKFNSRLEEEWEEPLEFIRKSFFKCIKDKRFETVKLKKVFKNGKELSSESYWDDYGNLRWLSVDITKYY